jgi:cell shape-determining protein MreC
MPVIGAGGLMGQVIQSFHHTSVVRLITDGQSKVGVTFGNGYTGIVDGQGPAAAMTADWSRRIRR